MSSPIQIAPLLDIAQTGDNTFVGQSPSHGWSRVFGGQVLGQSLMAAIRTVDGSPPHSMHAYFILPGENDVPITYEVDRLRDGKSFATRRVTALQKGERIFSTIASFHRDEPGLEHQAAMPEVPSPESLDSQTRLARLFALAPKADVIFNGSRRSVDLRPATPERYSGKKLPDTDVNVWMGVPPLPDDMAYHYATTAYVSDMTFLDAALAPHGRSIWEQDFIPASLDHAIWFHRPCRVDGWMLFNQQSQNTSGSRGLVLGRIFTRDGILAASVAQEGLMRLRT